MKVKCNCQHCNESILIDFEGQRYFVKGFKEEKYTGIGVILNSSIKHECKNVNFVTKLISKKGINQVFRFSKDYIYSEYTRGFCIHPDSTLFGDEKEISFNEFINKFKESFCN